MGRLGNRDEGCGKDSEESGACSFHRGWVGGIVGQPDEKVKGAFLKQNDD